MLDSNQKMSFPQMPIYLKGMDRCDTMLTFVTLDFFFFSDNCKADDALGIF